MIQVSKRFLILCEDEKSSLLYLDSFKKDEKLRRDLAAVSIEIYQPHDISPLGLVSEAKRKKKIAIVTKSLWISNSLSNISILPLFLFA